MLTAFYGLTFVWPIFFQRFKDVFAGVFKSIRDPEPMVFENLYHGLINVILAFAPPLILFVAAIATTTTLATFLQTKWNIKKKWIKFDLGFLNPISGIMKIFSIQGFITTGKAILKLLFILPIAYLMLRAEADKMIQLVHTNLEEIFHFANTEMWALFWKIMYILIGIAVFDYFYGKFQWFKTNKMTKDEVKDERKSIEGDEATKRKIINKAMSRAAFRIRNAVAKASVIITNPTHYSIALQYDRNNMKAPVVVAKGKGFMALKIREIAKEYGIPLVERKPVARALYASVEVGREIPFELYKAVAEVLAYVYKLKNPYANRNQEPVQQNNSQQSMRP
jgi:flagellar biosynthetic protein FlhB